MKEACYFVKVIFFNSHCSMLTQKGSGIYPKPLVPVQLVIFYFFP
jgi:hypothetical protein